MASELDTRAFERDRPGNTPDGKHDALSLVAGYGDMRLVEAPPEMSSRRMFGLALRTWPYMRPMLVHIVVVLAFIFSGSAAALVGFFVGVDLMHNKVLLGEKLQPIQATVLFVGDEYVTTDPKKLGQIRRSKGAKGKGAGGKKTGIATTAAATGEDKAAATPVEPELTQDQRRTVRNRLLMWTVVGGVFGGLLGAVFGYYSMWVWQCVNQNLRVAMIERAESLSLKYHDNSRVGDAIFRVYQDSAMIVNLIQSAIIAPGMTIYGLVIGIGIVAAFDPWFAAMVVLVAVPVGWTIVKSTPRIRRRALVNRVANSRLTSRIQEAFTAVKVVKANRAEARIFEQFDEDSRDALSAAYFLRLDMVLVTLVVALLGASLVIVGEYLMVSWVIEQRETFLGALVAGIIGFVIWNYGAVEIARRAPRGPRRKRPWPARHLDAHAGSLPGTGTCVLPARPRAGCHRSAQSRGVPGTHRDRCVAVGALRVRSRQGRVGRGRSRRLGRHGHGHRRRHGRWEVDADDPPASPLRPQRGHGVDQRRGSEGHGRLRSPRPCRNRATEKRAVCGDHSRRTSRSVRRRPTARPSRRRRGSPARMTSSSRWRTATTPNSASAAASCPRASASGLSIARAVVRDTPVLILDEPTASLDARTEQRVLANLAEWGRDRVIFLITHRLSTIRNADRIALIEDGRIVEYGTHDQLIADSDGRYRAFVDAETVGSGAA